MFFVTGVSILACIIITYFIWKWLFSSRTIKPLPGPLPLPLIGNSYLLIQSGFQDFLNTVMDLSGKYSSPFQVYINQQMFAIVYEPNQVQTILKEYSYLDKALIYKVMNPVFGTGLVTAPACIWTEDRKIIDPTFTASMLRNFFNTFVRESLILTEELEKVGLIENEIDHFEHIERSAIKISHDTMMGIKMETNDVNEILNFIRRWKYVVTCRLRSALYFDFIFNLSSLGREHRDLITFSQSMAHKMIQKWAEKKNATTANDDTAHKCFFDVIMNSHKKKFTQKEILFHVITMTFGASTNSSITMHFVIFMLANFPEIQEKVYEELVEIYGTETPKDTPVKYEDLQHMHYLNCVIKETLRLFPPLPLIGKHVSKDLEIGGHVIPKGADIIIPIIRVHRNEAYWPNPLKFDPERFCPTNIQNSQSYFIPSSDGPRNCIGPKYASILMKTMLATLIRTFKFEVNETIEVEKIKLTSNVIIAPVETLKVKIKKRNLL